MGNLVPQLVRYGLGTYLSVWALALAYSKVLYRKFVQGIDDNAEQFLKAPATLQDKKWGKHGYAHLKNLKLHYVEKGDPKRPLVLLLHGFPEFWYSWRYQLEDLSRDYWVVAPDMRGYGDSEKPSGKDNYKLKYLTDDVLQLIDNLGKTRATVVGHDWGGIIAWRFAMDHPSIVDKLVILNCPHPQAYAKYRHESFMQKLMSWYMLAFQPPFIPELYLKMVIPWKFHGIFWKTEGGRKNIREEDVKAFQYIYSQPGAISPPVNYYRANMTNRPPRQEDEDVKKRLMLTPILLIWGEKDDYISFPMASMSGDYVKDFSLRPISNASHWVNQDSPQLVNKYIRDFLTRN